MFIQMFKIFVDDAVSSVVECIAHLYHALTPDIRKDYGGALVNLGLYQQALKELQRRYINPQIVSETCTSPFINSGHLETTILAPFELSPPISNPL